MPDLFVQFGLCEVIIIKVTIKIAEFESALYSENDHSDPSFYGVFIISLTCYNSIPSFIKYLCCPVNSIE